jgi:hypothetical protein
MSWPSPRVFLWMVLQSRQERRRRLRAWRTDECAYYRRQKARHKRRVGWTLALCR